MENYIVRVYRRDVQNAHGVVGLVENVENEEKLVFHSLEELCSILSICNPTSSIARREAERIEAETARVTRG